jgi:hypothetical protein
MAGFTQKEDSELVVLRKVEKAKRALQFDRFDTLTKDMVMDRYRSLVKAHHPDMAGQVSELPPAASLDELRQAKDYLVKQLESKNV